mmetsp:Transcript_112476/g.318629  ORF Transcript_112476/g.318629 Transcript_112476/m.318629 type:complete len:207 (+) Transcript_112476:62-682(+)
MIWGGLKLPLSNAAHTMLWVASTNFRISAILPLSFFVSRINLAMSIRLALPWYISRPAMNSLMSTSPLPSKSSILKRTSTFVPSRSIPTLEKAICASMSAVSSWNVGSVIMPEPSSMVWNNRCTSSNQCSRSCTALSLSPAVNLVALSTKTPVITFSTQKTEKAMYRQKPITSMVLIGLSGSAAWPHSKPPEMVRYSVYIVLTVDP